MQTPMTYREQATYRDTSYTLRDRRNSLNLRLKDVAEKSGLSTCYLSQIEHGVAFSRRRLEGVQKGYGFKRLSQLLEALGVREA